MGNIYENMGTWQKHYGILRCSIFWFWQFRLFSFGWKVSDSFDVFKACKDGYCMNLHLISSSHVKRSLVSATLHLMLAGLLGRQVEGPNQRFMTQRLWDSRSEMTQPIQLSQLHYFSQDFRLMICWVLDVELRHVTSCPPWLLTLSPHPIFRGRISGDSFGRLVVRPDSGDPAETCKAWYSKWQFQWRKEDCFK